jgi:hypothetical protein
LCFFCSSTPSAKQLLQRQTGVSEVGKPHIGTRADLLDDVRGRRVGRARHRLPPTAVRRRHRARLLGAPDVVRDQGLRFASAAEQPSAPGAPVGVQAIQTRRWRQGLKCADSHAPQVAAADLAEVVGVH